MTCKFSGNVWPDHGVYPNLVEPRSTERQKVILVSPFDIQEASHIWGMTGKTGSESSRAAFSRLLRILCQASPLKTDLGGEVCFEPRQDTT